MVSAFVTAERLTKQIRKAKDLGKVKLLLELRDRESRRGAAKLSTKLRLAPQSRSDRHVRPASRQRIQDVCRLIHTCSGRTLLTNSLMTVNHGSGASEQRSRSFSIFSRRRCSSSAKTSQLCSDKRRELVESLIGAANVSMWLLVNAEDGIISTWLQRNDTSGMRFR